MDQITVTPDQQQEDPNYVAEMAAKGESAVNSGNTHNEPAKVDPKPDFVPDKFYDPATGKVDYEALAKSYQELERSKSQPKPQAEPEKKAEPPKENGEATEDAAAKAVEKAGLNMSDLQREFAEQGQVSDESYERLAKAGIPKETVDDYIAGQQALVEQIRTQAFQIVDGQENYQAMIAWAKANLDAEEIEDFNRQVRTKNKGIRETAIRGLHARYSAEVGADTNLAAGKASSAGNTQGYQSRAQMMVDMNDPRYKSDPAFRKQVEQKLAISTIF